MDGWVSQLSGAAVAPAVRTVRRVQVQAQVAQAQLLPRLRLPSWEPREIYSSI